METARFIIAVVLTATLVPVLLYWIIVHTVAGFLRSSFIFIIAFGVLIVGIVGIASQYELIKTTDLGGAAGTIRLVFGAGLLLIALWLRIHIGRSFTLRQLIGIPEILSRSTGGLVTQGIYSRVRHPRYAQLILASIGYAVIANYGAAYAALLVFIPGIYLVTLLEERELRKRFGVAYDDYSKKVPMFIPVLSNH